MEYKHAVYIGRFQPFHSGHLEVVKHGLEIADNLIIVVGSVNAAPNIRNPWSFEERKEMIRSSLVDLVGYVIADRVKIVGIRDYHYNDLAWIAEVQAKTDQFVSDGDSIALLGQYKDSSSHYLRYFPQWEFVPIRTTQAEHHLSATSIRNALFGATWMPDWEGRVPSARLQSAYDIVEALGVPQPVVDFLRRYVQGQAYVNICAEYDFVEKYKADWASAPYPPTFNTVDAIVICSGHVLVVKRKFNPGKGLYALPGGFIRPQERLQRAMLRELKEETGIRVDPLILESSIEAQHVFDFPERSLRGRTITHGFYLKLKDGRLPEVRANDDAADALWLPLIDVSKYERDFFEDHSHIINFFVGLQGGV